MLIELGDKSRELCFIKFGNLCHQLFGAHIGAILPLHGQERNPEAALRAEVVDAWVILIVTSPLLFAAAAVFLSARRATSAELLQALRHE
jgi:hypothetical protein